MAAPKGNQHNFRHGAAAGEKSLEKNLPLTGPAAVAQMSVRDDYEAGGAPVMIMEQAERLHAVSRLYFDAFLSAVQAGQLDKADNFAKRFGWLANSSIRAWDTVKNNDKSKHKTIDMIMGKVNDE